MFLLGQRRKKRRKRAKRLEKNLSAFYSMSSVLEPGVSLNEEPKSKMISDAANFLLTKLKELRAEEKQMKRRRKEEKAKSTKNSGDIESSSSSSSSGSSDSECETIVKMSKLKTLEAMQQRSMIEVCKGGKCKKSGALEVKEEFEQKVSIEGGVVGCKCMGKCRDGPNVRLVNLSNKEDDLVRPLTNPLCLGVGLEDVNSIVSNFFGEKDVNLLAA